MKFLLVLLFLIACKLEHKHPVASTLMMRIPTEPGLIRVGDIVITATDSVYTVIADSGNGNFIVQFTKDFKPSSRVILKGKK